MVLQIKGISYFTDGIPPGAVHRDLLAIRADLNCNAVMLIGTDTEQQAAAARQALQVGLDVYVRPHLPDQPHSAVLAHLEATAEAAELLRLDHPDRITLLLGSEFSLTSPGMVPGPRVFLRLQVILRWRRFFDRRITRKLNAFLAEALPVARQRFHGPITYAAAFWEQVDWSGFDLTGVSLYRFGTDPSGYNERVRALVRDAGRPVVITEFGCAAHVGGDVRGPGGFRIVNWFSSRPQVREGHVRDEGTQAAYLTELIELYAARGIHGCFVFTFAMPDFPHRPEPRDDLDMAGFGVVKVSPDDPLSWEPKEAFAAVARAYAAD